MDLNITLICVILLLLCMMLRGYKKGMTREISGFVALFAGVFVLAVAFMISTSFSAGEMTNTVYSLVLLLLFAIVYSVVKVLLRSAKMISRLPILHFLDSLMGIFVGFLKAILIIWVIFLLCANGALGSAGIYISKDITANVWLKLLYEYNFFIQ